MRSVSSFLIALIAVSALITIGFFGGGSSGLATVFGVFIPIIAMAVFILGFIWRIFLWAKSPVPFRIPTTGGQAKSLSWIKQDKFDSPFTLWQTLVRMFFEVFFFRSLLRNIKAEVTEEPRLRFGSSKWLWVAGMAFHYCFLIILLRHMRFFTDPTPVCVEWLAYLDGYFELLIPTVFLTDLGLLAAVTFLFARRVFDPHIRYISLPADYFPLMLILAIGTTGVMMRQWFKVDLPAVKDLAMNWFSFNFTAPADGIGPIFYAHLFLICVLLVYFPFSKLMHAGGVFLSPTRNLANNNRAKRHINPWNPEVKLHSYEEYEDEFREHMKDCGIPVDKE